MRCVSLTKPRFVGILVPLMMSVAACGSSASEEVTATPGVDTEPEASETTEATAGSDRGDADGGESDGGEPDGGEPNRGDGGGGEAQSDGESEATESTVDLSLFADGALVGEPTIDECTLTDGSTAECYTLTVVGTPVNHDIGPFCPTNVADGEDAGGLWLDGEDSYVLDGEFFTELADIYGDDLWDNLVNEDGSINVIDNAEDFEAAARAGITEEFYYHCVEGKVEWLDGGEQPTATIQVPVTPVLTDSVAVEFPTGAHSTLGVTLSGSLLAGSADMSAILSAYTIAAFDDCGGHINPGGYHIHGTTGCSDVGEAVNGETAPFAIAIDGHTVHAPDEGLELDECNGHTTDEYGYHYHANAVDENATLTCLTGLTVEGADDRNRGGGGGGGREQPVEE